jgi:hypothetical protein
VLLLDGTRPFAVLELKRPGLALAADDRDQGLSYARLMQPWAPLVIEHLWLRELLAIPTPD